VTLLSVRDLTVRFRTEDGPVLAVDAASFDVAPEEVLALVGESGCGKSVTALALTRLLPRNAAVSGSVSFAGTPLLELTESALRDVRGRDIAYVFQEPMTSLNPVLTVGHQIGEVLGRHQRLRGRAADRRALDLLDLVGIPLPARRLREYPHQLSGGMRQRVMIAMAVACRPRLLVADEPTTALDVTIQAGILDVLRDLRAEIGMAVLLITHDLGVVADIADRVAVMYAGRTIETAGSAALFARPSHPYTRGLLDAVPNRRDTPTAACARSPAASRCWRPRRTPARSPTGASAPTTPAATTGRTSDPGPPGTPSAAGTRSPCRNRRCGRDSGPGARRPGQAFRAGPCGRRCQPHGRAG
jgi:peptide/nickel transport system ATP-binding protein